MKQEPTLPIAVIGGGPVGLAAASQLIARGLPVKLYESGETIGANIRDWGHVRLFSPWEYNMDKAAKSLLERAGWRAPAPDGLPTGGELVEQYLKPLAATPQMQAAIETDAKIIAVSRYGVDKVVTKGREERPFVLAVKKGDKVRRDLARAVIDASGTWNTPNPMGAGGFPAEGEEVFSSRISYGIPDVLGRERAIYAKKRVLVVGAGHSAANALLDLAALSETEPGTRIFWAVRGTDLTRLYGGGAADQLPARGDLGSRLRELAESGKVALTIGFGVVAVSEEDNDGLVITGETARGAERIGPVDRIVAVTGQRPDLSITRELRLDLDPWLESAKVLGPMIDPNLHSCGSVPPHGHRELSHPEAGFYTIGVKSYGRAPTFLMATGYEQARSIAAALGGDMAAADDVQLVLPETGVCSVTPGQSSAGCCGGPAPVEANACCVADVVARDEGKSGCGCGIAA